MQPGLPVTVRPWSADQLLRALRPGARHPWSDRVAAPASRPRAGWSVELLRPSAGVIVNSTFPFGINEGTAWAGRGLTTVVRAGARLTAGPLVLRLEPLAFRAENNAFPLGDNVVGSAPGAPPELRFRDPAAALSIDQPQRFGDGAYQRVDLGESELRLVVRGVTAGASNAREVWGPGVTHPLVLGPNAPGFLHLFVGTARPASVGIGRVQARVVVGRLEQTRWSPAPDSLSERLVSAMVATFQPRWAPGLELGGVRFFHRRWTPGARSLRSFVIPLEGLLFKRGRIEVDDDESPLYTPDNQLASLFARMVFPGSRFEVYGELARNDAAYDLRELAGEPDHASAYVLGMRRLVERPGGARLLVRTEWLNARATHLSRVRPQAHFYDHNILLQGHTHRGVVLGSVAAMGGAAASVGVDRYDARGRTTLDLHRITRQTPYGEGAPDARHADVQYVVAAERARLTRGMDLVTGLSAVWELNRDFDRDAFNLRASVGARFGGGGAAADRGR